VVKKIAGLARDPRNDRPYDPPKITRIKITEAGHSAGMAHKSMGANSGSKSSSN